MSWSRYRHIVSCVFLSCGLHTTASAAVFTCASGNVACLIAAITSANSNNEANTITLAAGVYTLTTANNATEMTLCPVTGCEQFSVGTGLPQITSPITIRGANATTTIIERDPSAPYFRLFHVAATGTLQLEALTLRNGGGIDRFTFPSAFPGFGGGIFNEGTLTLANVILKGNSALFAGGGLSNVGTAVVSQTTFTENMVALAGGGGLYNKGIITLTNSAIVRNAALAGAGGIRNEGTLILTNSTLSSNEGSDLAIFAGFFAGALATGALENSSGGTAILTNTTIVDNRTIGTSFADGIHVESGRVNLLNTILAGNRLGDCSFTDGLVSLGHNLIGDCLIPLLESDTRLTTTTPSDPHVGDLVDTGQPGRAYHPVFPDSPAIDGGDNTFCPATDQLGRARVDGDRNGSILCDIGAIEFQPGEVIPAPDLIETFVSAPPPSATRGSSFVVKDVVKNIGAASAGASTTQHYLSLNVVKDDSDVLLTGNRAVPSLASGAVSSGTTTVAIPVTAPTGTYLLLTCADDERLFFTRVGSVNESNEANNCRPSGSLVIVR